MTDAAGPPSRSPASGADTGSTTGADAESETGAGFCGCCGGRRDTGDHDRCVRMLSTIDPPRYCTHCARRMVVQVTPTGWTARCSRHGETSSANG